MLLLITVLVTFIIFNMYIRFIASIEVKYKE